MNDKIITLAEMTGLEPYSLILRLNDKQADTVLRDLSFSELLNLNDVSRYLNFGNSSRISCRLIESVQHGLPEIVTYCDLWRIIQGHDIFDDIYVMAINKLPEMDEKFDQLTSFAEACAAYSIAQHIKADGSIKRAKCKMREIARQIISSASIEEAHMVHSSLSMYLEHRLAARKRLKELLMQTISHGSLYEILMLIPYLNIDVDLGRMAGDHAYILGKDALRNADLNEVASIYRAAQKHRNFIKLEHAALSRMFELV